MRIAALQLARRGVFEDILLPADTDTVQFVAPDEDGQPVVCEALKPGGKITIAIRREPD